MVSLAISLPIDRTQFPDTGGKAFNIIVPLLGVPGSPAELQIQDGDDEERTAGYKYEKDHGMYSTFLEITFAILEQTHRVNV